MIRISSVKRFPLTLLCATALLSGTADAGTMREDVPVQAYRNSAGNRQKCRPGGENISALKSDSTVARILHYLIPDFSAVSSPGYTMVISPVCLVSVTNNTGYRRVDLGNNIQFKTQYILINRNDYDARGLHVPGVIKVAAGTAPIPVIKVSGLAKDNSPDQGHARAGGGIQLITAVCPPGEDTPQNDGTLNGTGSISNTGTGHLLFNTDNLNSAGIRVAAGEPDLRADATNQPLIEGNWLVPQGSPMNVSIYSQTIRQDSDTHSNYHADNTKGISIVQAGGSPDDNQVKLAAGYVARGARAYDLSAVVPDKPSSSERLLTVYIRQYGGYRLKNVLTNSDGNPLPAAQRPDPQPFPAPLPAAFRHFGDSLQVIFSDSARAAGQELNIAGYHRQDSNRSGGDFTYSGDDFTSKSTGWLPGHRWESAGIYPQAVSTGIEVSKDLLSVNPHAPEGTRRSNFDSLGVHALLRWLHPESWWLETPAAYTRFRGDIMTDSQGQLTSPDATGWLAGPEAGKRWQPGAHRFSLLPGVQWRHLKMHTFIDDDQTKVRDRRLTPSDVSSGARYRLGFGAFATADDIRVTHRPANASLWLLSDGQTPARFSASPGRTSLQLKTDASLSLIPEARLATRRQYLKRPEQEGIDDWNIPGSVEVTF